MTEELKNKFVDVFYKECVWVLSAPDMEEEYVSAFSIFLENLNKITGTVIADDITYSFILDEFTSRYQGCHKVRHTAAEDYVLKHINLDNVPSVFTECSECINWKSMANYLVQKGLLKLYYSKGRYSRIYAFV